MLTNVLGSFRGDKYVNDILGTFKSSQCPSAKSDNEDENCRNLELAVIPGDLYL